MKILQFICHLDVGGAETLVKELATSFTQQGHQVTVLLLDNPRTTPHAQAARAHLESHGVKVISLERQPGQVPVAAALALIRLLRRRKYDVIHSHLPLPDWLASLVLPFAGGRTRHVSTIHNSKLDQDPAIWKWTLSRRKNVFCSHTAALANPSIAAHSVVIVNGTAFSLAAGGEQADRRRIRAELGLADTDILLLNVGRIAEQKNQQCLLHVVADLRHRLALPVHCLIVGRTDAASPNLPALATKLGITPYVHLPGARSDIPALLGSADLFVSTALWEGLPLSVLEAMFSGIPCVLSPLAGHREIATDVPAVFFSKGMDSDSVAKAVETAMQVTASRDTIRAQRSSILEPYTMDACTRSYLNLYRQDLFTGDERDAA